MLSAHLFKKVNIYKCERFINTMNKAFILIFILVFSMFIINAGIIINSPTEIVNTKAFTINITNSNGFNQTIIYSWNNGTTNTTLCNDCTAKNWTEYTFLKQGFFNLTVWANNSTGSIQINYSNNIFVGNDTFLNYSLSYVNITSFFKQCPDTTLQIPNNTLSPFCSSSVEFPNNLTNLTLIDNSLITTNGQFSGYKRWQMFYFNLSGISTINYINFSWTGKVESISGSNGGRIYSWNSTGSIWDLFVNGFGLTTSQVNISSYTNRIIDYVNNSNFTHFLVYFNGSATASYDILTDYASLRVTYYTPNSPPNIPTLVTPSDGSSQNTNASIFFNWTDTDPDGDNITYFLLGGTNNPLDPVADLLQAFINESGVNQFYTLDGPEGGFSDATYYWQVLAYDRINNINISSPTYSFQISTQSPAVTPIYPIDSQWFKSGIDIFFNFTAVDLGGLDTCSLWSNWTGTWHKNYTWSQPTNNTMNWTTRNITSDGRYIWNVQCNDTDNNLGTSINRTFGIDTVKPQVFGINVTTTENSQTFSYVYSSSDNLSGVNLSSCLLSIFNSSGSIDGTRNNVTCSGSDTVSGFASYNLTICLKDYASNIACNSTNFTTTQTPTVIIQPGGGGGSIIILQSLLATNYSISSTTLGNVVDVVLSKDSVKPRAKQFILINKGKDEFDVKISCDTTNLTINQSQGIRTDLDICQFVTFDKEVYTVSANEDSPTIGYFYVSAPDNAKFNDKYGFNVIVTRDEANGETYSKLSVTARVPYYGLLYKFSYIPFIKSEIAYPVAFVSFLVSISLFLLIFIVLRNRLFLAGLFLGVLAFFSSFILLILLL